MKLALKDISLKKDTISSIRNGTINANKYLDYIEERLEAAYFLIENKLLSLDELSLYEALSKIFDIELEETDLVKIMREKYNKHYTGIIQLGTNMVDNRGNTISLIGASTKEVSNIKKKVSLKELRKIVNSYDFIIFQTLKNKQQKATTNPENYEDYQFINVSKEFNNNDGLFEYKIKLLRNEIKNTSTLKKILNKTQKYISELVYQVKNIKNNQNEIAAANELKKEYYSNSSKKRVFRKGKHRKSY